MSCQRPGKKRNCALLTCPQNDSTSKKHSLYLQLILFKWHTYITLIYDFLLLIFSIFHVFTWKFARLPRNFTLGTYVPCPTLRHCFKSLVERPFWSYSSLHLSNLLLTLNSMDLSTFEVSYNKKTFRHEKKESNTYWNKESNTYTHVAYNTQYT